MECTRRVYDNVGDCGCFKCDRASRGNRQLVYATQPHRTAPIICPACCCHYSTCQVRRQRHAAAPQSSTLTGQDSTDSTNLDIRDTIALVLHGGTNTLVQTQRAHAGCVRTLKVADVPVGWKHGVQTHLFGHMALGSTHLFRSTRERRMPRASRPCIAYARSMASMLLNTRCGSAPCSAPRHQSSDAEWASEAAIRCEDVKTSCC